MGDVETVEFVIGKLEFNHEPEFIITHENSD